MSEVDPVIFQPAEFDTDESSYPYVMESDTPEPFSWKRLYEKVGDTSRLKQVTESHGGKGGWILLATGAIAVTAAGRQYFRKNYPEDADFDEDE